MARVQGKTKWGQFMKVSGELIMTIGTVIMLLSAILFLPLLILSLWNIIPDNVLKINGSIMVGGLFLAIIGLFIPNNHWD